MEVKLSKNQTIIGVFVLGGFTLIVCLLFFFGNNMGEGVLDIFKTFGTTFSNLVVAVVWYAFGSSQGSAMKTDLMSRMKPIPPPPPPDDCIDLTEEVKK